MNDLLERIENAVFSIMWEEVRKKKLSYVENLGYRVFFNNGSSIGLCTSLVWKQEKTKSDFNQIISQFYANELLWMKRQNRTLSVRFQGQSYCKFLKIISGKGNGNVLVICKFFADKIVAYYFVANSNNYTVTSDFLNDSQLFKVIVDNIQSNIDLITEKYKIENYSKPLFPEYVTQELFSPQLSKETLIVDQIYDIIFTDRQEEILKLIVSGCKSSKYIASKLKIAPKTVDGHVRIIRDKFQLHTRNRNDLVDVAKHYLAVLNKFSIAC